ncbi:S24/S26 family peptidase [Eubacterium barkeri]|uniref:Peptidase S24-like n=1 Tax=Eubacterium barkeri TaxID=1528 RepID=A0A1H3HJ93_EUBBA|nr:S24/S26 family peptidase [Eubacterium barkeri]SDY15623.1 hypothetical protein SAMN04488579_1188 [Eubacterium barkeri]
MMGNLEDMIPVMKQVFEGGGVFRLYPRGGSMLPFLRPGQDSVVLRAVRGYPPMGAIILYRRRRGGAYVLHRVVDGDGQGLWCVGDHQIEPEGPIGMNQVIAVVETAYRGAKDVAWEDWGYGLYRWAWKFAGVRRIFLKGEGLRRWIKRH